MVPIWQRPSRNDEKWASRLTCQPERKFSDWGCGVDRRWWPCSCNCDEDMEDGSWVSQCSIDRWMTAAERERERAHFQMGPFEWLVKCVSFWLREANGKWKTPSQENSTGYPMKDFLKNVVWCKSWSLQQYSRRPQSLPRLDDELYSRKALDK